MTLAVLSIVALAAAAPWLHRLLRERTGWFLALLPAGLFAYFALQAPEVGAGEVQRQSYDWVPSLGVSFAFALDGLSLLFALLITGIGALILIYAGGYLAGRQELGRFYAILLLFMTAMLGLVLADNVLTLFVFWELTSISSYLLIGFEHDKPSARAAALQALLVTNVGGLAMLAGLILLAQIGGSYEIAVLRERGDLIRADALYLPVLLLILAGAFTKSAQFPFYFWLPGAMEAPTPVSAYLHSATMVKAGVYLLARFHPMLGGTDAWLLIVAATGTVTMLIGGYLALTQTDLKRILAYSTVSALGTLVLLLGLGTVYAVTSAVVFLFAHALYKGALFMIAGTIDHETGTRDVDRLGGLRRAMPVTALVAGLAALSLAGFGPLLSFIGKELLIEAVLQADRGWYVLVPAVVAAGAFFVVVAGIAGVKPFLGQPTETPKHPHEAPSSLILGAAVLAASGPVLGLFPALVTNDIVEPSVAAVLGEPGAAGLALWHGFNEALLLSVVSVTLGILMYRSWERLHRVLSGIERHLTWGPSHVYAHLLAGTFALARAQTRLLQNGYLRVYLMCIIAATVGLGAFTLVSRDGLRWPGDFAGVRFYQIGLAALILAAAFTATMTRSRLAAVASLGVVGYSVALTYILFGAPDLAMTQFLIETLTVIIFVLVFYHLPRLSRWPRPLVRLRDGAIALTAGGFMTALVLAAIAGREPSHVATYYAEQSRPEAHGRNIVNVILVDFRGLDTLGEITVLGTAAIGVFALLKLRSGAGGRGPASGGER
jgi:multicomponent Na+:H+ antiporter subunit A